MGEPVGIGGPGLSQRPEEADLHLLGGPFFCPV